MVFELDHNHEFSSEHLKQVWKDWQPYLLVLLSLFLQIVLIAVGTRRKYTSNVWLKSVLWCAYLMADSVATVGLGVISNNLGAALDKKGTLDPHIIMTTFWAPFLLLHLGGPDNITAYSLEDNELWPRHFLGLGVQTFVALYILNTAWHNSKDFTLTLLSILMFFAGLTKYGERTWVLMTASNEKFRDSMITRPNVTYPNFTREYVLKQLEGFDVKADETNEELVPVSSEISKITNVPLAYYLFEIFKRLFVDLTLDFDDWYNGRFVFKVISFDKAFRVIEIELGFMYDVLYTKASIIHSMSPVQRYFFWSFRIFSFSCTCVVLVLFLSRINEDHYKKFDIFVSFLLLLFAVMLEVWAMVLILFSDWFLLWLSNLSKLKKTYINRALTCLQRQKHGRWSNTIIQFNLLDVSLKEKTFHEFQKFIGIDKTLEKHFYTSPTEVTEDLKQLIFQHLKEKFGLFDLISSDDAAGELKKLCSHRGGQVLEKYKSKIPELELELDLNWSIKMEFNQSILIWHVATDICYHNDSPEYYSGCELSLLLSQYMLYLLVVCRFMSPVGSGVMRFYDTCTDIRETYKEKNLAKKQVCKDLLEKDTDVPSSITVEKRSKSVLVKACKLASQLQKIEDKDKKWEMISNVWVEMLAYAAGQLTGKSHAQQLQSGGEFLTHVWLLMAHFGLNELFEITECYVRAKQLIVE